MPEAPPPDPLPKTILLYRGGFLLLRGLELASKQRRPLETFNITCLGGELWALHIVYKEKM